MPTERTRSGRLPGAQDAIALLVADHRAVARLFADLQQLKANAGKSKKKALVEQVCQALTMHTRLEEEIFYPAVREAIDDDDLMDEALVEHAGAKQLIAQLQAANPGDELYDARVTVLSEQIEHHVTEEEGNLFPQARGAGVDLDALGDALRSRRVELDNGPGSLSATTQRQPPAKRSGAAKGKRGAAKSKARR